MNKRFFKLSQGAIKTLCAVSVCASMYSCKDDYRLDDETPSWLGSSIYEYLQQQGNFKTFINLIDDLGYKEDMSRTGSRTLFVADDAAFEEYFKSNNTSYDKLTTAQKSMLINSAMLKNAYLLEMMSSAPYVNTGNEDVDINGIPTRGLTLRRETYVSPSDCVERVGKDDIPHNFNSEEEDYWARFRQGDKGTLLSLDNTPTMLTQFLPEQMAYKGITDSDFKYIMGREREKNDAFIYDAKVIKQDVTCQNGYVNVLDKVLVTPQNMAEVIRTNGETKIFSHLLDRFSAPFYDEGLTTTLRSDSVFQKRYFAERSQNNSALTNDEGTNKGIAGKEVFDNSSNKPLPFDPGWNAYRADKSTPAAQDMAAIFCPDDKSMMEFFFAGGGKFLLNAYAADLVDKITPESPINEQVYEALDRVPRNIIRAMLNNFMKSSFASSVPSKFESIKNSASDPMFDSNRDFHRQAIKKTLLANNGVVYVMDEVIVPAEYAAVSAPSLVSQDKHIFNFAIQAAKLGNIPTTYYAYLLAMSSRFTFFAPVDDSFWYIDPVSFNKATKTSSGDLTGKAYKFQWDEKNAKPLAYEYAYSYNLVTGHGELGEQTSKSSWSNLENRLKDMLETHTIIHTDESNITGIDETVTGINCDKHYYVTKNNAIVYVDKVSVVDDPNQYKNMIVKGGWLLQTPGAQQVNSFDNCQVVKVDDKSRETNSYGNGFAYSVAQPLIPTIESVYSAMYNNPNFHSFFELCEGDGLSEIVERLELSDAERFTIFKNLNGLICYDHVTGDVKTQATNVRFFNNYRYTVYVPTNEAIKDAVEKHGLPTWETIAKFLHLDDPDYVLTESEKQKGEAMLTALVNFIKYHFQDNAVFADTPKLNEYAYETATLDPEKGVYYKVSVKSDGNGSLSVKDRNNGSQWISVTNDKNIITRDYIIDSSNKITTSSSAVVHGINGVLNYAPLTNGRYDNDWKTAAKARAYINKYHIVK